MNLHEWNTIPWQTRNAIKAHYGIKPSAQVKVIGIGNGIDTIEDDGIREQDLEVISRIKIEDCIALKPISEAEEIVDEPKLGWASEPAEQPIKEVKVKATTKETTKATITKKKKTIK